MNPNYDYRAVKKFMSLLPVRSTEIYQGILSWVMLLSFGVAFPLTLEAWGWIDAMAYDYYVGEVALLFVAIFAASGIAKLGFSWLTNRFWIKIGLADWFYKMSVRIDPRRR